MTSSTSGEAACIAYEQADYALRAQAAVLDDARRRAGFLTALISGVATFLGGAALSHKADPGWVNAFATLPLTAFAAGLWTAVAVVLPARDPDGAFQFAASATSILDLGRRSPEDLREQVAVELETMWDTNQPTMDLYWAKLRCAAHWLMVQVVLWNVLLLLKEMI